MPAIPTAPVDVPWTTGFEIIVAVTKSAIEACRTTTEHPPPNTSHQAPLQIRSHHRLNARDPGASNANLGGGIVGGITLVIVFFIVLCLRRRSLFSSSPPSSPHSSSSHNPSRPPKLAHNIVRLQPTETKEGKKEPPKKPSFAITRRKAPKAGLGSWHPPPEGEPAQMERVHLAGRRVHMETVPLSRAEQIYFNQNPYTS